MMRVGIVPYSGKKQEGGEEVNMTRENSIKKEGKGTRRNMRHRGESEEKKQKPY